MSHSDSKSATNTTDTSQNNNTDVNGTHTNSSHINSTQDNTTLGDMPITEHLVELRSRLIKVFGVFLVIFIGLMGFSRELYDFISDPLVAELPKNANMIAINPTGSFMAAIKVTLYVAGFVSMPFILYQIWAFVAPGLYKREKKVAIPLIISSIVLFYAGVTFAYTLLTRVLSFLIKFAPDNVTAMPDIESYLSFVMQIFLVFGATFEIPIVTLLLVMAGVVSIETLEDKRRYIIVGCFAISAVVTPPDGFSMLILAVPMWMLFELGLLAAKLFIKDKHKDKHLISNTKP